MPDAQRITPRKLASVACRTYGKGVCGAASAYDWGFDARAGSAPDAFVQFAYELGRTRATGVLYVDSPGDGLTTLGIHEGAVMSSELDALGRHAAAELARLAQLASTSLSFRPGSGEPPIGRRVPLVQWVRQHIERQLDLALAARISRDLAGARVQLRAGAGPDLADLDAADRVLVTALARPRDLRELATLARVPRFQLLSLVYFLCSVGALITSRATSELLLEQRSPPRAVVEPPPSRLAAPRAAALHLLGLPPEASAQRVKAAFRALARTLHPDLHPGVGDHDRRELERRLASVNAAYAELTAG